MKFAADRTVGRLARSLRFLGYDTVFFNKIAEDKFLALANEGRMLLSRNRALLKKAHPDRFLLVEDNDPRVQLVTVLNNLGLTPQRNNLFSRCTKCNGVLETLKKGAALGRVPDHVWTTNDRFSKCVDCGKLYWPGSHLAHCRRDLQHLLQRKDDDRLYEQP